MKRLAIFAALQWECRPILGHMRAVNRRSLSSFKLWTATSGETEIWLLKTGVGEERAAAAVRALQAAGDCDAFLSTGCAGALSPALKPGDVAVATAVIRAPLHFDTDQQRSQHTRRIAEQAGLRMISGPILCSSQVLGTAAAKREAAASGAIAVEMEGAAIAEAAKAAGIPFVAARVILDCADTELSAPGVLVNAHDGSVNPLGVIRFLATQPRALSQLRALQRMMAAAHTGLDKLFAALLQRPPI